MRLYFAVLRLGFSIRCPVGLLFACALLCWVSVLRTSFVSLVFGLRFAVRGCRGLGVCGKLGVMDDKLKKLLEQKEILKKRIAEERAKSNSKTRKAETRRKILVGAALELALKNDMVDEGLYQQILDKGITNKRDREFMGLS